MLITGYIVNLSVGRVILPTFSFFFKIVSVILIYLLSILILEKCFLHIQKILVLDFVKNHIKSIDLFGEY